MTTLAWTLAALGMLGWVAAWREQRIARGWKQTAEETIATNQELIDMLHKYRDTSYLPTLRIRRKREVH